MYEDQGWRFSLRLCIGRVFPEKVINLLYCTDEAGRLNGEEWDAQQCIYH